MGISRAKLAQWYREDSEAKNRFEARLIEVKNLPEAIALVYDSQPDQPGRRYHSNLGWFLGCGGSFFHVPGGAKGWELRHYRNFVARLVLKDDQLVKVSGMTKAQIIASLEHAIEIRDEY